MSENIIYKRKLPQNSSLESLPAMACVTKLNKQSCYLDTIWQQTKKFEFIRFFLTYYVKTLDLKELLISQHNTSQEAGRKLKAR